MSIFTEAARDSFFAGVTPNIKKVITSLESSEAWTFILDESPHVYSELSSVVDALVESNKVSASEKDHLYDRLIIALSSISFSYSIIALCHLDKNKLPSGSSIAEKIVEHSFIRCEEESSVAAEARVIKDRVSLFIESGILVNMFSGLIRE